MFNRIIDGVPRSEDQIKEYIISNEIINAKEQKNKIIVIDQVVVVTDLFIYEGEVKSRPLISHGMSLPADLVVHQDYNTHLNSVELELLNKFL